MRIQTCHAYLLAMHRCGLQFQRLLLQLYLTWFSFTNIQA